MSATPATTRPPISAANQSNDAVALVVDPDDDRRDGVATRVNRVRDEAAIGSDEAVITIVGSRCRRRGVNVGAVRQETAVRSPDSVRLPPRRARAQEGEEHAENERNPEHVELLLLGPLGAADQETVAWARRNEGNAGCNAAARAAKSPANQGVVASPDRDSVVGMAKVRFRVLGSLEVEVDGAAVELGGARQRAVLAVLLVHANEPVATDRLVSESWGETAPATATKTAQVYVSRLRRTLGNDALATTPGGYLLRVPQGTLDTDELEELRARAREADPREAARLLRLGLALWRGPPYADLRYEEALQAEIARLEELRLTTLEERIEADLAAGEASPLVPELEALVREHPLRERLRGFLMLALYRSGRQAEALETYRQGRQLLDDELGLEPGPELRELERAILAHDPALDGPRRAMRRDGATALGRTPGGRRRSSPRGRPDRGPARPRRW